MTALCYECWCHIFEFYNFQQTVELAQMKYDKTRKQDNLNLPSESSSLIDTMPAESFLINTSVKDEPPEYEEVLIKQEQIDDEMMLPELLFECGSEETGNVGCFLDNTSMTDETFKTPENNRTRSSSTSSKLVSSINSQKSLALKEIPKIRISLRGDRITTEQQQQSSTSAAAAETASGASKPKAKRKMVNVAPPGTNPNRKFSKHLAAKTFDDLIHQMRPSLECEICSKSCSTFSLLQYHCRDAHPDEEFYIMCCDRKFTIRSRLEEHLRMHSNEPFVCDGCGKCFKWKITLRRHMRSCKLAGSTNSGDKTSAQTARSTMKHAVQRHKCSVCHKSYTRRHTLREHMALHTGSAIHRCHQCPKTFVYRAGLRLHLQRDHSDEESKDE